MTVDELCRAEGFPDWRGKFSGLWTKGIVVDRDVVLLKPQTYMNLSGESVEPAAAFLKVDPGDVLVVHDELDLPFGDVRLKLGGGHAGHNGLRSIIERLGTADFVRVRVGIGRPPADFLGEMADYVLRDFDPSERAELPGVLGRAVTALKLVLAEGVAAAMTVVNKRPPIPKPAPPPPEAPAEPTGEAVGGASDPVHDPEKKG